MEADRRLCLESPSQHRGVLQNTASRNVKSLRLEYTAVHFVAPRPRDGASCAAPVRSPMAARMRPYGGAIEAWEVGAGVGDVKNKRPKRPQAFQQGRPWPTPPKTPSPPPFCF